MSGPVTFPEVVTLNVGGTLYSTSLTTLRQDPSSMLARMFSGLIGTRKDPAGNYFIDRDGTHFGTILNYLRDGDVDLPTLAFQRRQLLRECLFYQIKDLVELLGGAADLVPPRGPVSVTHPTGTPDQTELYAVHKELLYQKHKVLWDAVKDTIKMQFVSQVLSASGALSCSFPLQQDLLAILPFLSRELQEEGLRDLLYTYNYQSGITFALELDKLSDGDLAEQQVTALKLIQQQQQLRQRCQVSF